MNVLATVAEVKQEKESQAGGNTWIQITFTLNPEQYRVLWERADDEHRTIPSCVRESVVDYLKIKSKEMGIGARS